MADEQPEIDALIEAHFPGKGAEETKIELRQASASMLDGQDEGIELTKARMTANANSCSGILKMRARKDGVTYTASLCTSARVYIRGVPKFVSTRIVAEQ